MKMIKVFLLISLGLSAFTVSGFAQARLYEIVSKISGKGLDVLGGPEGVHNHGVVQQWDFVGNANQVWRLRPTGDGYVQIFSRYTNLCLDVPWGRTEDGVRIQLAYDNGGYNQQWRLIPAGHGFVRIVSRNSGKCLDVVRGSPDNGARICQFHPHGFPDNSDNQKWQVIPAN